MKTRQNKVKPLRRREKTMVRKGWKRENSLPPPTYAAGGSYRRGLGPRGCQTFARPSVVELFHRRACYRPPRNFFSLEITARNDERRPRNLTRMNVLFKDQLRGYYSSTGIARNLSKRVRWSRPVVFRRSKDTSVQQVSVSRRSLLSTRFTMLPASYFRPAAPSILRNSLFS